MLFTNIGVRLYSIFIGIRVFLWDVFIIGHSYRIALIARTTCLKLLIEVWLPL